MMGAVMERVFVLDRVPERHPDVSKQDAADAWNHCVACTPAFDVDPDRYLGIGIDNKGRYVELVAVRKQGGLWLVIHAQTPPQEDIKRKLGFGRRKK
jgi:hypothetical protein